MTAGTVRVQALLALVVDSTPTIYNAIQASGDAREMHWERKGRCTGKVTSVTTSRAVGSVPRSVTTPPAA
jgi:hypothetical protein